MKPTKLARRAAALLSGLLLASSLAACSGTDTQTQAASTSTSGTTITTSVLQNAAVTIACDAQDGYDLVHQGVNFDVSKDGKAIAYGFLVLKADYDSYVASAKSESDYEESTINGASVITYTDSDIAEALIAVPDGKNYIYLRDASGMDSLDEVLKHLTFTGASQK